ncbi:NAD(P)H-binding protein [Nocardia sp. NPDC020380]|uniref:NAD(P)H-binding protein n=1 Tax=Nocardia sp. NPDC020380 TaxID=3364309 RepID=UPI0037A28C01
MRALIVGASGYNGGNVARRLAAEGYTVRGLVRTPARAPVGLDEVVCGDAVTGEGLHRALEDVDVAYYFVHALDAPRDTDARDERAARAFVRAARETQLSRGVFFTTRWPHRRA